MEIPESASEKSFENVFTAESNSNLTDSLEKNIISKGFKETAATILGNEDLKKEILKTLLLESHQNLKSSLKHSQMCADKNDRKYLTSLTPRLLCEEFKLNSSPAFLILVQGILGITDPEVIFESQFLVNNIAFLYSTVSKVLNRKATGYALLMTTAARDGGLREDSIKLFSMFVHPRTSQKYDKEVLSYNWDQPLKAALQAEKDHFQLLHEALEKKSNLEMQIATDDEIVAVSDEVNKLFNSVPLQVQKVWDNLNLRTKHRFQRERDDYSKSNFDWMASIFIKDRINVNHMDNGKPVKAATDLKIED